MLCMILTFVISGKNFGVYNESNARMNSMIVEYMEGIEVIKAFGRVGTSYEKYASAIKDYKQFVVKWMSSTWVTMKLAFVLFPATLLGVLPVSLYLQTHGAVTVAEAALAVMLAMSMVTSLAKLEVFSNDISQMKNTVLELQSYLEMPELPEPKENAQITNYTIRMENVHFSYAGSETDEATASIDPENEHLIQQAISELTVQKTVIVIAHRLATIENADQILVVDDGRIAQSGTHNELIGKEGIYKRFVSIRERAEGWSVSC